jgi:hypothetical protein
MRFDILADMERRVAPILDHIKAHTPAGTGFAVLLFRFDGHEATYGSNAQRADMIQALRECADRLEQRMDKPIIKPESN